VGGKDPQQYLLTHCSDCNGGWSMCCLWTLSEDFQKLQRYPWSLSLKQTVFAQTSNLWTTLLRGFKDSRCSASFFLAAFNCVGRNHQRVSSKTEATFCAVHKIQLSKNYSPDESFVNPRNLSLIHEECLRKISTYIYNLKQIENQSSCVDWTDTCQRASCPCYHVKGTPTSVSARNGGYIIAL